MCFLILINLSVEKRDLSLAQWLLFDRGSAITALHVKGSSIYINTPIPDYCPWTAATSCSLVPVSVFLHI